MPDVLRVDVQPPSVELTPGGEPAALEVRIFNGTTIIDEFHVGVVGTGEWLEAPPASLRLFPDKEGTVTVPLSVPGGRLVPAGERTVGIQVTSSSTPSLSSTKEVAVRVAALPGAVALTLQPQVLRGGSDGHLTATISNGGNAPLDLTMSGTDAEGAVTFSFSPEQVQVPMGGSASVRVRIAAARAFFGTERQRSVTVRAEGSPTPLTAAATFVQAPRFTPGSLRLLRTLLTLLAAAALIGGAFATWVTTDEGPIAGVSLDYREYADLAFDEEDLQTPAGIADDVLKFFTSAGFVAIFFGTLVLLGALTRTGKTTRVAGLLALIAVLALFVVLFVSPEAVERHDVGGGAITAAVGAVVAIVGGSVGT